MSRIDKIKYITLKNAVGAYVVLSNVGAGIVSINVPDRDGNLADVTLGYKNPADYLDDGPCMGKIPGRYANRIARGCFSIDGIEYQLALNNGPNALHGGPTGFANRIWDMEQISDDTVRFTYTSADGEEGYPARLVATATYRWTDNNSLELTLEASADAPSIVNLTNHAYFNLNGEDSGSALAHTLWLNASRWLPTDNTLVPTGEMAPVEGTPMDFTVAKELGADIHADFPALRYGKGYDNCWIIDGYEPGVVSEAAVLASDKSGRVLRVYTTQPAVQVYTGNWLEGSRESISGHRYHDYDGVAIECQGCPDAPNRPEFPPQTVAPDKPYRQLIIFEFSTI